MIEIKEEVQIGNIILEVGDRIEVLKEGRKATTKNKWEFDESSMGFSGSPSLSKHSKSLEGEIYIVYSDEPGFLGFEVYFMSDMDAKTVNFPEMEDEPEFFKKSKDTIDFVSETLKEKIEFVDFEYMI